MKKILALTFVLLTTNVIYSQNKPTDYSIAQIDSILEAYKTARIYNELLPFAMVGLEKTAKELGKQDTTYARMLYFLGFGYQVRQDNANATIAYQEAIQLQKALIPKHPKYIQTLHNFALLQFNVGNYTQAETLYKEALKLRKEIFGQKHSDYAIGLNALAILYKKIGNYSLAKSLFKESLQIRKETLGTKEPVYADALNNLAILYMEMGDYAAAESLYKAALDIRNETLGNKDYFYIQSLVNLAVLYYKQGSYALAEPLYKESLKSLKETLGETHPDYIQTLNNLGVLYNDKGDFSLAEPLLQESLKLRKEVFGEEHPSYAESLENLASFYESQAKNELAESLYKTALKIRKEVLGELHPDYARNLNNLGALYKIQNNYALAESYFEEALEILKKVFGEKNPQFILSLNNSASLYSVMRQEANAWNYVQQAIAANTGLTMSLNITKEWADSLGTANYVSRDQMIQTLINISNLVDFSASSTNKELQKAKQVIIADLALGLFKKNRDSFVNEADKLRTLSLSNDWVLRCLENLNKETQANKAFELAEQSKSVLLMDAAKTEQAHSFGDLPDSLVQQELMLQKELSKYEANLSESRSLSEKDSLRILLNQLNLKIKDFKKNIEKSYPKYAALKYQHKEANVQEIQKLLDGKTALLEYVIGDSTIYVFYIDSKKLKLVEQPIAKAVLTEKIKALHNALSNYEFIVKKSDEAYQEYSRTAHWFYQNLVAPSLKNAKGMEHLIIITDGELGFLPFESFLVEPAKQVGGQGQTPQEVSDYAQLHYLINDYSISYNYSATLWKENKDKPQHKNNGQLLAMASNYETKIDSSKMDWRLPVYQRLRASLNPLPAAQEEVEVLQTQFQGYFGLNNLASEKVFKEKAADFAIIHLAMHGILDSKNPILSSLAFTEDGDSLENNFLQAYEISKMNLNADLVVLSACETGYGKFEKGNGIASLARAFMYAGASSLVVSLWQVNDHSTSVVMQNFYANLADGMVKDAALRQAKLDYIRMAKGIAAHPAFWSAFVQMGDSRPITFGRTRGLAPMWAMVGGIITILAAFLIWKKRKKNPDSQT